MRVVEIFIYIYIALSCCLINLADLVFGYLAEVYITANLGC